MHAVTLQLNIRLRGHKYTIDAVLTLPNDHQTFPLAAVLSHGGGSLADHGGNYDHSGSLPCVAAALAASGIPCLRYTFNDDNHNTNWLTDKSKYDATYRLRRDAMAAVLISARRQISDLASAKWVLGGFSWSANAAAELSLKRADVAALLLIEFDYHRNVFTKFPLEKLTVPTMFIIGSDDTPSAPLLPELWRVKAPFQLYIAEGASRRLHVRDVNNRILQRKTAEIRRRACNAVKSFSRKILREVRDFAKR